jgi:hypothetical protein
MMNVNSKFLAAGGALLVVVSHLYWGKLREQEARAEWYRARCFRLLERYEGWHRVADVPWPIPPAPMPPMSPLLKRKNKVATEERQHEEAGEEERHVGYDLTCSCTNNRCVAWRAVERRLRGRDKEKVVHPSEMLW